MTTPAQIERIALPVLVLNAFEGAGISTEALVGAWVESAEIDGNSLRIVTHSANGQRGIITFTGAAPGGGDGLDQAEVDARIAPYARVTPSGTIADAQIPQSIARDSELPHPSNALPIGDGTAAPGSASNFSRADHVQSD